MGNDFEKELWGEGESKGGTSLWRILLQLGILWIASLLCP